jgi:SAM-dependent methyltransferase
VLEQILETARSSGYDFRATANPNDPLKYLFDQWVDYYRLKWSIARVLQPASILEVGVRYGYSAATFLDASPQATYLGIDLDSDSFGGVKGAMLWAEDITRAHHAEFLVGDTQKMSRFPGGIYDLVHVDGQQDGDGSWHDLQLAIKQARWVLVDGYFWTSQNFLSISYFLHRYRDVIRFYGVIPGYAGELLIQVSPEYLRESGNLERGLPSDLRRESYTTSYYLQKCPGFEQYNRNGGKNLEGEHLQVLATLASARDPKRVLDLGCGRGELAHFFADLGAQVTAVDYSEAAIQLSERTFEGEPELRQRVQFVCADLCNMPLDGVFDAITAADLIEHLLPQEVEQLYARVSKHLSQDGLFVIHTYPNCWYYQYEYARKRRIANAIGSYLPPEPRTRDELLMNINEQSPRVLKRSLQRHFEHVALWLGEPGRPFRSLLEKMSHRGLAASRELYAIASHSPIDLQGLRQLFASYPIPEAELSGIELTLCRIPGVVEAGATFEALIELVNGSQAVLASGQPNPVHISYHWLDDDSRGTLVFDGERSAIMPPLMPGRRRRFRARVHAPLHAGKCALRLTLVQESVRWFDEPPVTLAAEAMITVNRASS